MAAVAHSRQGTPGEAIDGVTPRVVAEPTTGAACAAALASAASGRLSTVIRGGGTKSGWGRPVDAIDPRRLCNPGKVLPTPRLCGEVPGPYREHPVERAGLGERF